MVLNYYSDFTNKSIYQRKIVQELKKIFLPHSFYITAYIKHQKPTHTLINKTTLQIKKSRFQ